MKAQDFIGDPREAVVSLAAGAAVRDTVYGARAMRLARIIRLGLKVPPGYALSFTCVRALAEGEALPDLPGLDSRQRLIALRSSPRERGWGEPGALLNIGISDRSLPAIAAQLGEARALSIYRTFIPAFGFLVHGIAPDEFDLLGRGDDGPAGSRKAIAAMLARFEAEAGQPFPHDPRQQLEEAARAMAQGWDRGSARMLRQARGAPPEAGLGLVVQEMAAGGQAQRRGARPNGTGVLQLVDSATGGAGLRGRYMPDPGAAQQSLTELPEAVLSLLSAAAATVSRGFGDAYAIDFALTGGGVTLLDASPVARSARATVRIAVDLAAAGVITREQALLRVEPRSLIEHLHPQIDPKAPRDVFGSGLAASPGAATGHIVFTAEAAQTAAARDEATILVRAETSPEDIRGMHAARGVLTLRGGMTSHAAVIARGIGLPCVVGAGDLRIDRAEGTLTTPDGRTFREGALITLDGTRGEVMAGAPATIAPELGGAFSDLLDWADAARDIGVRANADTPAEASSAREFRVDGIGLCRTEHMFFDESRLLVMREMILADTLPQRRAALDRLLPMQRADFLEIFGIMRGLPVAIRLLDPPLHEFLPHDAEEIARLAEAIGLPVAQVSARARELAEVNPMLGMRGVRLGVVMPEIYDMQARAIFEAAIAVNRDALSPVVPEVMIPLVSANREVELVKARIDAVAAEVQTEQGMCLDYKLGVMVETPRAALRSGDLAASSAFLSFGTNDLTQMTYGLSRDDAGRFMRDYVNRGVFREDPFHSLDLEGVGELLLMAAQRGRARNANLTLGLCGEHGGDPSSVRFCKLAGFDYVSCSPFRVPIARLAAAQACILARTSSGAGTPE